MLHRFREVWRSYDGRKDAYGAVIMYCPGLANDLAEESPGVSIRRVAAISASEKGGWPESFSTMAGEKSGANGQKQSSVPRRNH